MRRSARPGCFGSYPSSPIRVKKDLEMLVKRLTLGGGATAKALALLHQPGNPRTAQPASSLQDP